MRFEFFKSRRPYLHDCITEFLTAATGSERNIAHVCRRFFGTAVGIEGVLENTAHQNLIVTSKTVFCPIAVMYIEIDDRNTLKRAGGGVARLFHFFPVDDSGGTAADLGRCGGLAVYRRPDWLGHLHGALWSVGDQQHR